MTKIAAAALLLAGCGAAASSVHDARPADGPFAGKQVDFIRVMAWGAYPPVRESAAYQLCVDAADHRLLSVRRAVGHGPVDAALAEALRAWTWHVGSTARLEGGRSCWVERFEPRLDAGGEPVVDARVEAPLRSFEIVDERETIREVAAQPESERIVSVIAVADHPTWVDVVLAPQIHLAAQAPPSDVKLPQPIAGQHEVPHLPDAVRIHRLGSDFATMYQVCVGSGGDVKSVLPVLPIAGGNDRIVGVLKAWRYPPQPQPICSQVRFVFHIGGPSTWQR